MLNIDIEEKFLNNKLWISILFVTNSLLKHLGILVFMFVYGLGIASDRRPETLLAIIQAMVLLMALEKPSQWAFPSARPTVILSH